MTLGFRNTSTCLVFRQTATGEISSPRMIGSSLVSEVVDRNVDAMSDAQRLADAGVTWQNLIGWARENTKMQIWLKGGEYT